MSLLWPFHLHQKATRKIHRQAEIHDATETSCCNWREQKSLTGEANFTNWAETARNTSRHVELDLIDKNKDHAI